ncbi:hypothetical protein M413DRAFT_32896 [Hebeloma cylindrosporum]|uniref:Uncharacterized protein n=1 Tax=Hebeloma cylindrosporum TaxID=76867 RepID=A0A0C2Y1H1_HEBCY|nr:hypothetical protein M413DRAFT_32896 [Hebeloma cylindrosporum h7]
MAPAKPTKKNAPSKTKATQAKGKENSASIQASAAKKKNQLRKDSGSRTALVNTNTPPVASGAGSDSTIAATSAAEEIERLKVEVLLLRKENANAAGRAPDQRAEITAIPKPRGEAGSKGFKLIREMGLDDTDEHKKLYRAITRSVRDSIIKRSIDLSLDFRKVDPDDLSAIFKWTRKMHPYMLKARFPQNWATAELVKQYMRNHRRYEVKKGRMPPRNQRSGASSSGNATQLANVDSDDEQELEGAENDENENEGSEANGSGEEEDE